MNPVGKRRGALCINQKRVRPFQRIPVGWTQGEDQGYCMVRTDKWRGKKGDGEPWMKGG